MFDRLLRGRIPTRRRLKLLVAGWVAAEILLLVLAIKALGLGGTVVLSLATSALGIASLRRLGLGAATRLRMLIRRGSVPDGSVADGLLQAFGALLLILPGFASDLIGLALSAPSTRRHLLARFGMIGVEGRPHPRERSRRVIDLSPEEWFVADR